MSARALLERRAAYRDRAGAPEQASDRLGLPGRGGIVIGLSAAIASAAPARTKISRGR